MEPNEKSEKIEKTDRIGKDEMNLVEQPFALLKRVGARPEFVMNLEWEKTHPRTGKPVKATWRVTGDPELGLPGPSEERLFLVLMEMTREQNWARTVYFTRRDILRRLKISDAQSNYKSLHDWLLRLSSVNMDAQRSFWSPAHNDYYAHVVFSLIDEIRIVEEAPGLRAKGESPLSWFKWSDTMMESFQAGNVRSIDIDFALSLELPLSVRLYRFLDKHRYGKNTARAAFEIELARLCEIHLGMATSPYPSKLKERLASAHDELIRRGFLSGVSYRDMKTKKALKVVYAFAADTDDFSAAMMSATQPVSASDLETPKLVGAPEKSGSSQQLGVAAWRVWRNLDVDSQETLRAEAREGVDSIFWDRLEVPESPLALKLWEIVRREWPAEVAAEWPRSEAETMRFFAPLLPDEMGEEGEIAENVQSAPENGQLSLEIEGQTGKIPTKRARRAINRGPKAV